MMTSPGLSHSNPAGYWSGMLATFSSASNSIQAIAALFAIITAFLGATTFLVAQVYNIVSLRRESHRYVMELYRDYLRVAIEYPALRLGYGLPAPDDALSADQICQRDTGFDLLSTLFETAFLTYSNRTSADRRTQWRGWEQYIQHYVARPDYQSWWFRIILGGDLALITSGYAPIEGRNLTQFDIRFERFIFPLICQELLHAVTMVAPQQGSRYDPDVPGRQSPETTRALPPSSTQPGLRP